MQSKLVENWLTNAGELTYTAPFVQLLINEGYTVLQAKGGPTEQGKDIIARDTNGNIHCYQLKHGSIGSSDWQQYRAQLDDLTEIPPKHPSIPANLTSWQCHLVTNGDITGQTSITIVDYSKARSKKGNMALQTTSKEELLRRFTDSFGRFFPIEPNDIRVFFELFCDDGDNTLKRSEFKLLFEHYLSEFDVKRSKQKKLESIQAAPILTSYLLTNKYAKENYTALIDAWVLMLLTILHYAAKWSLDEKKYAATESLILDEIDRLISCLFNDVATDDNNLVDASYGLFSEPIMTYKLRCAELLGYISAAVNYSSLSGRALPVVDVVLAEKMAQMHQKKIVISEAGLSFQFNYILASAIHGKETATVAELIRLVDGVLSAHVDEGDGLLSPYYTTEQAVANMLDVGEPIDETFNNRSYMLWPAVLLLAKYDQRDFLNDRWQVLSEISMEEIVAHDSNDLLLWRIKNADLLDTFPNSAQSWASLRAIATKSYDNDIPAILLKRKYLIPLWVLAMPHRLTPNVILSLVNK
ncbi:hypothetical protein IPL68_06955 [Candidatus Saccharibacteria bacterium]|nr:MAG: hypothetical protein IPL68_06955 [Candidatus Saccharibacteria bacterium]